MGETDGSDAMLRRRVAHKVQPSSSSDGADEEDHLIPPASWTFNKDGLPQAIAHRGYKAEFPENTMGAFRGAVEVGAHAIETDVHLSKDDVVVISHDKDLKRCYGEDGLVRDHDWAHLSTLRTLAEPRQPMPRLADVLAYLAEPGREHIWLLLDIKIDDPADVMIPRLAATLAEAAASASASASAANTNTNTNTTTAARYHWERRVVLGCWTAAHLRLCHEVLPGFAIAWIGITLPLAREYLRVPNVAMNMRQEPLYGLGGRCFVRECQARRRPLYAWTVNGASWMRWAIDRGLDGVITDDPKKYLDVCQRHRGGEEEEGEEGEEGQTRGARRKGGDGVLATVRGFVYSLCLPLLIRFATRRLGYYGRVGTPAEAREVLKDLVKA